MRTLLSLLFIVSFYYSPAQAFFVDEGETGAAFLQVPVGARAAAMGTAFTAVKADITALEYNPAGMHGLLRSDTNISHQVFIEDTTLQAVSFGYPFYYNAINKSRNQKEFSRGKWVAGGQYRLFNGDDKARNNLGASTGEFDVRDQMLQLALAYGMTKTLSIGLSGKYIQQKLDQESLSNQAFDAGFNWAYSDALNLAASILNVGSDKAFISEADPLPSSIRIGAAYQHKKFLITADGILNRDSTHGGGVGTEWKLARLFQIRAGTLYNSSSIEFTAGFGIHSMKSASNKPVRSNQLRDPNEKYKLLDENNLHAREKKRQPAPTLDLGLDYAIRTNSELGLTHSITVKLRY